jgi:hydroxymethylbilane synthase
MTDTLTIATRGSALALWQANHVQAAIALRAPGVFLTQRIIKTTGDLILDVPLSQVGGKALFVKEIEQALLDGAADLAVHSMKDVPAELAPGLALAACSRRETPFDALCTRDGAGLEALPDRAVVGTSSLRRQCQLLARRPDLQIRLLRGNVPTRLAKLDAGDYDAVVLAAAGLVRLGYADRISEVLAPEVCLPAVGQGVLGLEIRADDDRTRGLVVDAVHDPVAERCVTAERAFLARMGGSCQTPLAALARIVDGPLVIDALCGTPDGTRLLRAAATGPAAHAAALGVAVAEDLLGQGAAEIVAACQPVR